MKTMKLAVLAMGAMLFAACSQDDLVSNKSVESQQDAPMSFNVRTGNMTRAAVTNDHDALNNEFGVYGVKDETQTVFDNYVVRYTETQPTAGGATWGTSGNDDDNISYWYYDGITNPAGKLQYLKYWDKASTKTEFFGYVPYDATKSAVQFAYPKFTFAGMHHGLKTTRPDQAMLATIEYMAAYKNVPKVDYGKDVPLQFKRLNGKVQLAFYEVVAGYDVRIDEIGTSSLADFTTSGNLLVDYATGAPVTTWDHTVQAPLGRIWANPVGTGEKHRIGYSRADAVKADDAFSRSTDEYYCVPADANVANGGMRVSIKFTLMSLDTNETITVTRTVDVTSAYTQWEMGKYYTYVFRIQANPNVDTDLVPIVFDGITVSDYEDGLNGGTDSYTWIVNPNTGQTNPENPDSGATDPNN